MESGNTLIHSAGVINTQFLHDMDAVAMNRFMSNAEQGGNTLIIIVGNEQFEDLTLPWWKLFAQSSRRQFADAFGALDDRWKRVSGDFSLIIIALSKFINSLHSPTMSLFTISTGCWQRSRERRSAFSRSTILMAEISLLIKLKIIVWASGRCFSWMTSA